MPFAVVNRLIEEYNTNGISSVLRADNILDVQLSAAPGSTFSLGDYQIVGFKENDILPLEYGGGTILAYPKRPNGTWGIVHGTTPSSPDVSAVLTDLRNTYSGYTFSNGVSMTIEEAMKDGEFKTPYTTASKTWRGGNSGWYDELATLGEEIHGYQRARWFKFASKSVTKGIKELFKEIAKSRLSDGIASRTIGSSYELETHTGDDGDPITTEINPEDYTDNEGSLIGQSEETASKKLKNRFIGMASTATDIICAGVQGFMGVQTLVSTYQRVQKMNLLSGFMEAVQKVQVGDKDGNDSMHEYSNNLTIVDPETGKSAMGGSVAGALFNNTPLDADDPEIQAVNTEKVLSNVGQSSDSSIMQLFGSVVGSANRMLEAYKTCIYVKGGLSIVSAVVTGLSLIPGIGQGIAAISLSLRAIATAFIKAIVKAAVEIIVAEVIKYAGNILIQEIATDWLGPHLFSAMASGGNMTLATNHQTGGGSPGSAAKVTAFRRAQSSVIADEAKYQRSVRSPFDINSQHTFLGSIVYSLIPLANSSGVGTAMKNISSVMSNSVSKILPSASAIAETNTISLAESGDCQSLESVGIQGSVFCDPNYITDEDTITDDYTPREILNIEKHWGYITENSDGGITIKDNTNLTRYINYCGQRTSSFGLADANISYAINQNKSAVGTIIGALPILGDLAGAVSAVKEVKNLPWITGSACVASETNEYWCENKIHQRFIEDQRFFDGTDSSKNNPVVAYLDDYYDKNPIDNSFEGTLARFSGMTKEDVIATLDLMDFMNYLADYHPEERIAFGVIDEPEEIFIEVEKDGFRDFIAIEPKHIVYDTLRYKSVLV